MGTFHGVDLERLRYWQGQTLRSRDFRHQARVDALRRELHNRALHPGAGIAFGLGVTKVDGDPPRLRVACGLAYDCRGRLLLLQQGRDVAAPAVASWLFLRVRAEDAEARCGCGSGDPGCERPEASMADADVELIWTPLDALALPQGVVLARYREDLDPTFGPPRIRPLARSRLARGKTVRGNTPWEPWAVEQPDGQGGVARRVVGVQTRIDTSAAGFTRTPVYLASIDAPEWDPATAEFAPAFFPHVADPSIDGFTFRLLMVETARRRYTAASGVARVTATSRGVGDGLQVTVDDAAPFKQGDMVSLLRPRARTIVGARPGTAAAITLAAPLANVEEGRTAIAIGNLPRLAKVTGVTQEEALAVATFAAAPAVRKGDVLRRAADGATAVIASVSVARKQLKVKNPFASWTPADDVQVARLGRAVTVSTVEAGGAELVLSPATHAVTKDAVLMVVDEDGTPLGAARTVTGHRGATIEIRPPLAAAEIVRGAKVAAFAAGLTIADVQLSSPGLEVEVASTAPFAEGDFVAVASDPSAIAAVRRVVASTKTLELDTPIRIVEGDDLVAANWLGAATVTSVLEPTRIAIGRTAAVPQGAFVVRRLADDGFSVPAVVDAASAATLGLRTAIPDLARLDTIAIGSFPRLVNVLAQQPDQTQIQILATQAGQLQAGDEVVLAGAATTPTKVAQVVAVSGNSVSLSDSLGPLAVGQALAVVHFRDRARVSRVVSPTSLELEPEVELRREGDVVGVLTHYVDVSNPGYVQRIEAGNRLILSPSIRSGDGIVNMGWIDGGVLGPAALAFSPADPSPEWRQQPVLRLLSTEGLGRLDPALVYGLDLLSGRFVVNVVIPFLVGADHVVALSPEPLQRFRYRPETLSLVTTFNTDFPRAFATFAQKQRLAVSWIACQEPFPRPAGCPGQRPSDPCADAASAEA